MPTTDIARIYHSTVTLTQTGYVLLIVADVIIVLNFSLSLEIL